MISFKIIDNLFTKLKEVYGNFYCKKHTITKFKELKMGSKSFNIFYLKVIKLAAKFEFTKEMLLQKFMHKLFFYMQDRMNFELKYPNNIKNLAAHYQKICDQILAIN